MLPVPESLARTVLAVHGEAGRHWLARLPERLDDARARWGLTLEPPFEGLTYHWVAPATRRDGTPVVLKLGLPGSEDLVAGAAALRLYAGAGAVRLLDAAHGALLLERLAPGTPLAAIGDDDEATRIAGGLMRRLRRPAPPTHPFPTLAGWLAAFGRVRAAHEGGGGPIPEGLLAAAEARAAALLASAPAPVVLHGDLHHGNVLAAERAPWLAIDPKGVVGDPAFEPAAFLRNPAGRVREAAMLGRRIALVAEAAGLDPTRVAGWAFVGAVLSAAWSWEDGDGGVAQAVAIAGWLEAEGK